MSMLPLARRGLQTSRLVLGCMSFGGGWNREPVTDEQIRQAEHAVDAARAIGITLFDTADIYTMGKSEMTLGAIFKRRPDLRQQIIVQSKCGIRVGNEHQPSRYDFSAAYITHAVEASLQRLQTDYLDVLLLHRPDPLMEPEEVAEAFSGLKAQGKVRYFGVSNMNVSQMRFLQRALPDQIAVNQLELSLAHLHWLDQTVLVNQDAGSHVNFGEGLLEYCQTENIQIQAWGSLAQGQFTGRTVETAPDTVQKTATRVRELAEAKETTPEAIVLGWLMRHPARIQPVIGTMKPERIAACADAQRQADGMTREEWYTLYESARGKSVP